MNSNKIEKYLDENRTIIQQTREQFLKYCKQENSANIFYETDIDLVKRDDWWTLRFLMVNNSKPEKALKHMVETFRWRKTYGILDRTIVDSPIEFTQCAGIIIHGKDHKQRPVIYLRLKVHHKIPELDRYFQQYLACILEHVDQISGSAGFIIVFEFFGAGVTNIDMNMMRFLMQLLSKHYPCGIRIMLLCNMSQILRPLWATAKALIGDGAKRIHFCSKEDLVKYIPKESIPRFLGGESDFDFTRKIETLDISACKTVDLIGPKYGFSNEQIEEYKKIFEPSLKEAQLLVSGTRTLN